MDNPRTTLTQGLKKLKILLIGKGGREHALACKLGHCPSVDHVFVYPGNGGTEREASNVSNIQQTNLDFASLAALAKDLDIGLVVVGPDDAVVSGIERVFSEQGIPCFAPTKEAAVIEGSKTFAKHFMSRHKIPTAAYQCFDDIHAAQEYVGSVDHPIVIKADGLAGGKGVVLPDSKEEAKQILGHMMVDSSCGRIGAPVVIEEFMEGREISVLTFTDGKTFKSLPPSQDHKRIGEGNKGPNTGGMGVYAPVPFISPEDMSVIEQTIIVPTLDGLRNEGRTFRGMLFTGVMMTASGPKVLEYNARFGDPETQSLMLLLSKETDLAQILLACTQGSLHTTAISYRRGFACNVVVASRGYPGAFEIGVPLTIDSAPEGVQFFHAGTAIVNGRLVTSGGRVISVAAYGDTLLEAVQRAYRGVAAVRSKDLYFRNDIATQALDS